MIEIPESSVMKEGLEYKYFMGGNWLSSISKKLIPVKNPYNGEIVGKIQACTKEEVDRIINTARESIKCWKETPLVERAQILRRAAELMIRWSKPLGHILMKEIGKPEKSDS